MNEKYYTKETGWTEAGIKEQERRADLSKLTARDLEILCDENISWPSVLRAEIRRRLERLEKCEAVAEYAQHHAACTWFEGVIGKPETWICTCGYDAARAALEGK